MERRRLAELLGGRAGVVTAPRVLLEAAEPAAFRQALADAVASEAEIFLADAGWSVEQRAAADALVQVPALRRGDRGWLMIPTGGSSGGVKFARHDGYSLAAAVRGFGQHFGLTRVNAVSVLPLHHVSGFMAWMRCALTGGVCVAWDWKQLEGGAFPPLGAGPWVLSLVPTQLDRLLRQPAAVEWLRGLEIIFLGGAPAWPELLERAAAAQLPLSLSYGMTESAAMIAALRPAEFLAGERSAGSVLPHARVMLDGEGVVQLSGSSLFRGYFPEWRHERTYFATADLGALDVRGRLTILGRRDAAIITGGEKVQPVDVERALRPAAGAAEFAVIGLPDAEWGERVVCVFAAGAGFDVEGARAAAQQLGPAQRPKAYLALSEWPRNEAGKVNRARLRALASAV